MNTSTRLGSALVLAATCAAVPVVALAWHGNKTVATMSGTLAHPGTLTGTISVAAIPEGTTLVLVDAFQALPDTGPAANRFYTGAYSFVFSNCTGGTAVGGTEHIGGGGSYPSVAPAFTGAAPQFVVGDTGSMSCDYKVTFIGVPPSGTITGLKNDVWMLDKSDGSLQASFQGLAPLTPPVVLPEVPVAALLPLAALALLGARAVAGRRRLGTGEIGTA